MVTFIDRHRSYVKGAPQLQRLDHVTTGVLRPHGQKHVIVPVAIRLCAMNREFISAWLCGGGAPFHITNDVFSVVIYLNFIRRIIESSYLLQINLAGANDK